MKPEDKDILYPKPKDKEGKFVCRICGVGHATMLMRESCEQSHETVTLTLYREDLFRLLQFLMTKDESLLSPRLMKTLQNYKSGFYTTR